MPGGVPVATVAIGQAKNAGILAVQIVATEDEKLQKKLLDYKKELKEQSMAKNQNL
jgi:5-(carboxyamino)imidazole ribonucleotide mutase